MRRAFTVWLLLAIGLSLVQPAVGSWRCPDGTLCVAGPDGSYRCAGGVCKQPCCAEPDGGCESRCQHGALPGVEVAGGSAEEASGLACICVYTPAARMAVNTAAQIQLELPQTDVEVLGRPGDPALVDEPTALEHIFVDDPFPPPALGHPPTGLRAPPSR